MDRLQKQKKNIVRLLKRKLPINVFRLIRKIGSLAQDCGLSAYIVGGFVRDVMLGIKNLDLDIVVEGKAIDFAGLLKNKITLDLKVYRRFGTATVTLPNGFKVDIASARKEHYAYAAALPEIQLSSVREDSFRRDFTINALAIKINRHNFGQLLDLFEGQKDLIEGKVKVLHDRSFIDDPTRILRAIRFEQRYNFSIERYTEKLIREAIRLKMLNRLSKFRIGNEIILILKEDEPLKSLLRLSRLCGLKFIHPLIKLDKPMEKQFKSARKVIDRFRKIHPDEALDNWLIYFMFLTISLSLGRIKKLCRDFSLTKADTQKLESFKRSSSTALKKVDRNKSMPAHQVYQILHPFSYEAILVLLCMAKTKRARNRIRLFLHKLSRINLKLTGKDLQTLKLKPGPRYKDILEKVLYAKIDGKLKSKLDELNYVKHILRN